MSKRLPRNTFHHDWCRDFIHLRKYLLIPLLSFLSTMYFAGSNIRMKSCYIEEIRIISRCWDKILINQTFEIFSNIFPKKIRKTVIWHLQSYITGFLLIYVFPHLHPYSGFEIQHLWMNLIQFNVCELAKQTVLC